MIMRKKCFFVWEHCSTGNCLRHWSRERGALMQSKYWLAALCFWLIFWNRNAKKIEKLQRVVKIYVFKTFSPLRTKLERRHRGLSLFYQNRSSKLKSLFLAVSCLMSSVFVMLLPSQWTRDWEENGTWLSFVVVENANGQGFSWLRLNEVNCLAPYYCKHERWDLGIRNWTIWFFLHANFIYKLWNRASGGNMWTTTKTKWFLFKYILVFLEIQIISKQTLQS